MGPAGREISGVLGRARTGQGGEHEMHGRTSQQSGIGAEATRLEWSIDWLRFDANCDSAVKLWPSSFGTGTRTSWAIRNSGQPWGSLWATGSLAFRLGKLVSFVVRATYLK